MSAISGFINTIRNAVYGEQVRGAIISALEQCYDDVSNPSLNTAAFDTAIANAYAGGFLDIQEKSTIAGMTNQKIIYRYTGNEAGYINGALYFFNGTEWAPIGSALQAVANSSLMTNPNVIYKYTGNQTGYETNALYYHDGTSFVLVDAPVETDKTLTTRNVPADAKAVGQALDDLQPDAQLAYSNRPAEAKATGTAIKELLGRFDEIEPYIDRIKELVVAEETSFDVSSLPDYWEDAVRDALVYTTALGDDYVHHLFTTDNHYDINYKKSVDIQRLLWATGLYSKVINLGDITDTHSQTQADNVIADYSDYGDDFLLAIGNHDDFGSDNSILLPLIENNENLQGNDVQHFNYYLDDDVNKIRYIVHNAPNSGRNFTDKVALVKNAPSGYQCMILSHYPAYGYTSEFSDPPQAAWNAMGDNGLFDTTLLGDVPLIGFFCGHEHIDYHKDYLDAGIVHQNTLSNDGHSNDAVHYQKTVGTNTEQAITIVSVNTARQKVKFYRIGMPTSYGRRWEYSYKKSADEPKIKRLFLGTGGIVVGTNAQYTALPALDNDKKYYLINNGDTTVYWEYRYDYLNGTKVARYSNRWTYKKYFQKVIARQIVRPATSSADKFIFGFETNETTGNLDDFEIVTSIDQYDFGFDFADVPWTENRWLKDDNTIQTIEGYALSDLINLREGEQYKFSVDDANWNTQYLYVYGMTNDGVIQSVLNQHTRQTVSSISFTVPDGCRYVVITGENLVGYLDKVQLEQTS